MSDTHGNHGYHETSGEVVVGYGRGKIRGRGQVRGRRGSPGVKGRGSHWGEMGWGREIPVGWGTMIVLEHLSGVRGSVFMETLPTTEPSPELSAVLVVERLHHPSSPGEVRVLQWWWWWYPGVLSGRRRRERVRWWVTIRAGLRARWWRRRMVSVGWWFVDCGFTRVSCTQVYTKALTLEM